ncbi:double-strand break repair helicase AddA [Methylovirgula sp. HY1]|uniref:double-strand break repair helicase AddA n=1 Tax=Methylovirgula sp. HY1 TaxID=2822761 RepID=UPI001C5BE4A8|nr:double-strand break repair helicase AddA [Methylovirgula sp. HY1]QXX74896.1 ATP-dependent helicase/nuclease subunit A [Methylovirgula sp. HY1]
MSAPREIPAPIRARQLKASDPKKSVWVSANAGSGKTHVLAQRVLRLLLADVPPAKILCLTFTKAAAANMATKVFATLAKWTDIDDAALAASIEAIGAGPATSAQLIFARRLFARTVETPGGLKIHTIHAFCERLLHLFPFEANVPGRFEVLEDLGQAELLTAAKRMALASAESDGGTLGQAYAQLIRETSQADFDTLIKEAMHHRALFRATMPDPTTVALRRALGLGPDETLASIETEMIEGGIAPSQWEGFASFLAQGSKTDRDKADLFRKAESLLDQPAVCLAAYLDIFFTKDGDGRKKLVTKDPAAAHPDLVAAMEAEQARLDDLRAKRKAAACFERSVALAIVIGEVLTRYEQAKAARGVLDFDDLIARTLTLLERSDARWVLFKLDSGIDHILVDEAQDTSETQWKILEELTGEFAAGIGSRDTHRTFFAVGDEKQSIFSFQGAAPHMFHAMRGSFGRRFGQDEAFEHVQMKDSFRSVPAVLTMVDEVFADQAHQKGLVTDDIWMGHEALKRDLPGLVEIWPPLSVEPRDDPRDWQLPLDMLDESDPASRLAQRVAQKIGHLLVPGGREYVFDSEIGRFRLASAGDILILVRTRGAFFEAVIRALKQNKIPVAGADRLQLTQHIAVMDLMAAGRAALLPQDDLTLAAVLKSPLIGLDDDDLLKIAPNRQASLFEALADSHEARHQAAYEKILRWRSRVALTPFGFYARLLSEDGGRRAMEGRLGPEACDALDEFLRLALRGERDGIFSLARFLCDLDGADLEIKRDMETSGDCVRVMTVHAAKGLEAKIVFLPDTCGVPSARHDPKIFCLADPNGGPPLPVWSQRKDQDPQAVAAARETARASAEDEYRRLLYVALTRAEERLYIAGFYNAREPSTIAWNTMIQAALGEGFEEIPAFWDMAETIRRRVTPGTIAPGTSDRGERMVPPETDLPDFLRRQVTHETSPLPPLKPASALAAADMVRDAGSPGLKRVALERGRLMHVLLQYLPQLAPESRRAAAQNFLSARAGHLDCDPAALIEEALGVLETEGLVDLFSPQARAEVAITGRFATIKGVMREVSGQVDRIVETATDVIIADYKTGTVPEAGVIPPTYVTQMALYRATLAPLWPGKKLRMLLIFTAGPKVVELQEEALEAALMELPA